MSEADETSDGNAHEPSGDEPLPGDVEPDTIPWEEYAQQAEGMIKTLHWCGYEEQAEQLREIKALFEMRDEKNQDAMEKRFPHGEQTTDEGE